MTEVGVAGSTDEATAATGRAVLPGTTPCVAPAECACCGEPAASSRVEERRVDRNSLIVPYCTRCLRHASAGTTRNLAAAVSSCLVAATVTLALPLAWPSASLASHLLVTGLVSLVPLAARFATARRPSPGHTATERAVWWLPSGVLVCTHARFAESLARASEAESVQPVVAREPRFVPWLVAGPVIALVAGPAGWYLHHPLVRVLNLTETRLTILLDGRAVASVEPTSSESPAAGIEIRLPTGPHQLGAVGPGGELVAETHATLQSGARHLYAPASHAYCFWLEETRYGRASAEPTQPRRLDGVGGLWVLPQRIDTWFAENPPPSAADERSSGGVLVALRQARCELAPAAVR